MTSFHAWPHGRLIEIQINLRRKKLSTTNPGSSFHGGSFSNTDHTRAQFNLEEKVNPRILKDNFPSKTDQSIFTPIAPVLFDRPNKTSWVFPTLKSTSHFSPQSKVSCRSDSSSEASSSCCQWYAYSHFE